MTLQEIIRVGIEQKATDIHLEPQTQIAFRIGGLLKRMSHLPTAEKIDEMLGELINGEQRELLETRGSADLVTTIAGVPCRINALTSDNGYGLVIRLLSPTTQSLQSCNLHPSIGSFLQRSSGLLILTGPTGSGKSTTLSALLEEINTHESRHIVTLESPIEYRLTPRKSIVRQREVGRHTPSYEQGLLDALREDPDVLVVGEMREAEAMRMTLNAAETGHLVMATMHSSSATDAIYRMMMSFPPERQSSVLAQLADTLIGIVSHRMTFNAAANLLVPCCEIMVANHATRNVIRKGEVSKMVSLLQTGAPEGMFTFERYQTWLDQKTDWVYPKPRETSDDAPTRQDPPATARLGKRKRPPTETARTPEIVETAPPAAPLAFPRRKAGARMERSPAQDMAQSVLQEMGVSEEDSTLMPAPSLKASGVKVSSKNVSAAVRVHKDGRIEIPEVELDLDELVREFETRHKG